MSARPFELLPYGDRALLVELGSTEAAIAYAAALRIRPAEVVGEIVPAARTVLVVAGDGADVGELRQVLLGVSLQPEEGGPEEAPTVEVPVTYDGADLADVAGLTGLSEQEVVAAHTSQTWRVAFGGFAPGFGYLLGEDDRLHVPRRTESRTQVPAGAVGLAGEYSGIYPRTSPGGWQLIGHTDVTLWDLDRDPPALLSPGVRVRFVRATS